MSGANHLGWTTLGSQFSAHHPLKSADWQQTTAHWLPGASPMGGVRAQMSPRVGGKWVDCADVEHNDEAGPDLEVRLTLERLVDTPVSGW